MKKLLLSMALVAAGFGLANAQDYTMVTSVADLTEGSKYVLAGTYQDDAKNDCSYTIANTSNSNNRKTVAVTIANQTISNLPETAMILTIHKDGDSYTFSTDNYAAGAGTYWFATLTANSNHLKMINDATKAAKYSITIAANGDAEIITTSAPTNGDDPTKYRIRLNPNKQNGVYTPLIAQYKTSTTTGVSCQIYKLNEGGQTTVNRPVINGAAEFYGDDTEVTMTAQQGAKIYYTVALNGQTPADPTTSSTLYTEPLTISSTATFKAIAELNGQVSAVATATFTKKEMPTVENIAAFLALEKGAKAKFVNPVEVSFGGVWDKRYLFVKDATGSLQIFCSTNALTGTYQEGQTISGFILEKDVYNGTPQGNAAGFENSFPATATGRTYDVQPLRINGTKADIEANLNAYVYLYEANITKDGTKLFVGDIQLYDRFKINGYSTLDGGQKKDIEGFAVMFNTTPEIYVTSFGEPGTLGVNENRIDNVLIYGAEGMIVAPQGAEIYGVNGVRYNTNFVAPGLYIVRYKGTTVKVVVK